MNSKEQRAVGQVQRLFSALNWPFVQILPQAPPCPDVLVDTGRKRIAVEATDYHGDEADRGGSTLRQQEEKRATHGLVTGALVPIDPMPGLIKRLKAKTSNSYDLTNVDEAWLVIFACLPQMGALTSTFLIPQALDLRKLSANTAPLLEKSAFNRCLIHGFVAHGGPWFFSWQKGSDWCAPQPNPCASTKRI